MDYNVNIGFKEFINIFERSKQHMKDNNIIIDLIHIKEFNYIQFSIILNLTYEKDICIFSTSNEKLISKIICYLFKHEYNIKYETKEVF